MTRVQQNKTWEKFLTFKEDKIPITVFINRIDTRRQAPPEVSDLHGVSIHHPVVSHSPKPLVLQTKQKHLSTNMQASMAFPCAMCDPSQVKLLSFSLSHIKTVKETANQFAYSDHNCFCS